MKNLKFRRLLTVCLVTLGLQAKGANLTNRLLVIALNAFHPALAEFIAHKQSLLTPAPSPYQRGRFNPTGLGEQLLKRSANGSVAYIGCNTGSQPCGLTLVEGFVNTLAQSKEPRLGDCWNGAIRHYFAKEKLATIKPNADWYPPSIFFQGMKFMVFGDPSLRMPGNGR